MHQAGHLLQAARQKPPLLHAGESHSAAGGARFLIFASAMVWTLAATSWAHVWLPDAACGRSSTSARVQVLGEGAPQEEELPALPRASAPHLARECGRGTARARRRTRRTSCGRRRGRRR